MSDPHRIDSQKLSFHPWRVVSYLSHKNNWETAQYIYPLYVEVSPVGACNHRCTFCAVDYIGYKSVRLDAAIWGERIREMAQLGIKSVMFAGEGEPLLHTEINQMVQTTHGYGVDVAFTTNGVLLHKLDYIDRCTWIKVSLNAGTRETYAKVHRTKEADFDKVVANLRDAVKRKGNCTIGVQMVVLPENEHEIPILQALCDDIGVDYVVFKPYSQHKFSITRLYENFKPVKLPSSQKSVVREAAFNTDKIPYNKCSATPFFWAYIMASGDVYSCSAYLLDERFNLGNLNDQSFVDIWRGEKRRLNYEFVKNDLDINECRVNCRMDKVNRYLNELEEGVPHGNFI